MKNNIVKLCIFTIGAAIGSIATWQFVKTKYERIANEEIESVKEAFRNKQEHLLELNRNKVELDVYKRILDKTKYDSETVVKENGHIVDDGIIITEEEAQKEIENMKREGVNMSSTYIPPHIITPGEFGSYDDYETESLNYYADGVLTTIFGDIISEDDVEEVVGDDPFSHFGEYETDTVYVRNDNRKIDYEILRDDSKYSELYGDDDLETE